MNENRLDTNFDETNDRRGLLLAAADQLDALDGHLGSRDSGGRVTPEGALVRDLTHDVAEFADVPVVTKITEAYFLEQDMSIPSQFKQWEATHTFYWVDFPINLFPRRNWGFDLLEVAIEFNPRTPHDGRRPKAYQILPHKKFQTMFEANTQFEIRFDVNFQLAAHTGPIHGKIGATEGKLSAEAGGKIAGSTGIAMVPYIYRVRQAKIDHSPEDVEKVFWRLDGKEFFEEDTPRLTIVTKIPKETREVKIDAFMKASRYFNFAPARLQQRVKELPTIIRNFFLGGIPIFDKKTWDITPFL